MRLRILSSDLDLPSPAREWVLCSEALEFLQVFFTDL